MVFVLPSDPECHIDIYVYKYSKMLKGVYGVFYCICRCGNHESKVAKYFARKIHSQDYAGRK